MNYPHTPFRLNVGFIIAQGVGFSRDFDFDFPQVLLPPDLRLRDLTGASRITRTPQGLLVQTKVHANLQTECARCLTEFFQPLDVDFTELYAFSNRTAAESGLLLPEDGFIDLEPLLREYMLLDIPINPLCQPDCKGLCAVCGENQNFTTCQHVDESIDPRLAVLKKLKPKR